MTRKLSSLSGQHRAVHHSDKTPPAMYQLCFVTGSASMNLLGGGLA